MKTASRTLVIASALLMSLCLGVIAWNNPITLQDSGTHLAARYHLRSRTSNFYQRAGRTTTSRPTLGIVVNRSPRR